MAKWEDLVEKKIREAMREGAFDNLPGKGQPLRLDENPFEDPTMRTAHRMLRDNGFTLPWIEERKEIDAAIDDARAQLARAWDRRSSQSPASHRAAAQAEEDWQIVLTFFRRQVADLNRRIAAHNLKTPSETFHRAPLSAEHEINKVLTEGNTKGKR